MAVRRQFIRTLSILQLHLPANPPCHSVCAAAASRTSNEIIMVRIDSPCLPILCTRVSSRYVLLPLPHEHEIRLLWLESTPRAGQSSTPESPIGMWYCRHLKNLTEIRLLWIESISRAPFDDVPSPNGETLQTVSAARRTVSDQSKTRNVLKF